MSTPSASSATPNRVADTVRAVESMAADYLRSHMTKAGLPVMTKEEIARLERRGIIAFTHEGETTPNGKGYIRQTPYRPHPHPAQDRVDADTDHAQITDLFRKLSR